jgi:hypothetical protein
VISGVALFWATTKRGTHLDSEHLSRRLLLQAIAATIGAAAVPSGWAEYAAAAALDTHAAAQAAGQAALSFFSKTEAADVEAVAAQIIPTDETPGAREVGVINFIDRALATIARSSPASRRHFAHITPV